MSQDRMFPAMVAAASAHRACCGSEHDPLNGKLHGCCVVCGVAWPCETAQAFLFKPQIEQVLVGVGLGLPAEDQPEGVWVLESEHKRVQALLAAIDAAKAGEPAGPSVHVGGMKDHQIRHIDELRAWGRQGWDAAAALRVELDQVKADAKGGKAVAREMLDSFVQPGHPGVRCLRSGWIPETTVDRWRTALESH